MKTALSRILHLTTLTILVIVTGCTPESSQTGNLDLTDAEIEDLVRRSYQFVAMYNVNNKFAMDPTNPSTTNGWNKTFAATELVDHTMQAIARPNNDTLYAGGMLDLRKEPIILECPAFDSTYVSLMVTGYDHFVNIPMSTRQGHFSKPSRILFYTQRTPGYSGEPVEGVDYIHEATGDFVSAVFRVMPHANEPERMARNIEAMKSIKAVALSELLGGETVPPPEDVDFPAYGRTDFDVFENNFMEVMQFILNHTTFEPDDVLDQELLAILKPMGLVPGQAFDPALADKVDGARLRAVAERIAPEQLAMATDEGFMAANVARLFQPKGQIPLELLLFQSVLGPIGQPAAEAVYPSIGTKDNKPMNASNDYVIRMSADELPPATAFWSATLYDNANGFFMPNERKKYSVGENGGMQLDENGGIAIHISETQPEGVPDENWLPLVRGDYAIDVIMRIYAPDLEKFATWTPPVAERMEP
ncbi:MAG: DUF1214 domain-containing protein [Puniceicoccaceae bacterium]